MLFLLVDYEAMSYSEQLHHRLNGLPAFKLFSKVLGVCCAACISDTGSVHQRQCWTMTPGFGCVHQGKRFILEGHQSMAALAAFISTHVRPPPFAEVDDTLVVCWSL